MSNTPQPTTAQPTAQNVTDVPWLGGLMTVVALYALTLITPTGWFHEMLVIFAIAAFIICSVVGCYTVGAIISALAVVVITFWRPLWNWGLDGFSAANWVASLLVLFAGLVAITLFGLWLFANFIKPKLHQTG